MTSKLREMETLAELKELRLKVMELETQAQVSGNQLRRKDEQLELAETIIREQQYKYTDLESKMKHDMISSRIREAEHAQIVAEINQKISRLEVKNEEMVLCTDVDLSLNSSLNNLDKNYIEEYLNHGGKESVIVLWNGHSDLRVLKKLGINNCQVLNITCYDIRFNQNFSIRLESLETKQILFEVEIGTFPKTGRLLNLEETHDLICKKNHKLTHTHDPRTDIKLTKCVFDFVVRKIGYENLIKYF